MSREFKLGNIDKNILYKKYVVENKSFREVGLEMSISKGTIQNAINYYNIPKRHPTKAKLIPKKVLVQKYITENKSMKIISKELKRSIQSIHKYLHLYGIKVIPKKYIHWTQRSENKEKVQKRNVNVKKAWNKIKKNTNKFEKIKNVSLKALKKANKALCKTTRKYPNKKERLLNKILKGLLGNEYKFVGNGKVLIENFNPDFINVNGQKKIIEHFGDYWHNLPGYKIRDKKRLKIYRKYGYETLIIWEHELKDLTKVKNKIKVFNLKKKKRVN